MPKKELKHYVILTYSIKQLSQNKKVKFLRDFFGYSEKKGSKIYIHKGLVEENKGIRLSHNVVLIPINSLVNIQNYLNKMNIKAELKEVWMKE